jgi:microcystin-dependent protein
MPYIGEIRIFAGTFPPNGWMFCDGALLPISENETLFAVIGTAYGGDGEETFALPDLRGRVPIHQGNGFQMGQNGGAEEVTLTTSQIASHAHPWLASSGTATSQDPANQVLAAAQAATYFNLQENPTNLAANAVGPVGGSQPHENMQPYLGLNFIISLFGVFPSPT